MLEDIDAFLDVLEEYGNMDVIECNNNADVDELDYVPEQLEDCDAACVYWTTIKFEDTRVPDDRLPGE